MSLSVMTELSRKHGLGVVPLACAPHLSSSVIYCGVDNGTKFVIKLGGRDVETECKLLRSFAVHPNIIRPITTLLGPFFFTMPHYSHTLTSIKFTHAERSCILRGVADGVIFIAKNGLVHGDLKLTNIFINWPNVNPVIADFGFCHQAQAVPNATLAHLSSWTVKNGTGIQAVRDATYYITDALMFVKHVFLPMCGLEFIQVPRDDVHIAIADSVMDIHTRNDVYANAVSDLTIISMIRRRGTMFILDPLRIPDIAYHLPLIMTKRLRCTGPAIPGMDYVQLVLAALLEFTRFDSSGAAVPCWIKMRDRL